jgi:hypothetical protein
LGFYSLKGKSRLCLGSHYRVLKLVFGSLLFWQRLDGCNP